MERTLSSLTTQFLKFGVKNLCNFLVEKTITVGQTLQSNQFAWSVFVQSLHMLQTIYQLKASPIFTVGSSGFSSPKALSGDPVIKKSH